MSADKPNEATGLMKEPMRAALVAVLRGVIVLACIVTVIIARTFVGWSSVLVMLAALLVLVGVLWTYRPNYR